MTRPTSLALARSGEASTDLAVIGLLAGCERIATGAARLAGPGAAAVRSAAQKLMLTIELYAQDRRRLGAEVLRQEHSTDAAR